MTGASADRLAAALRARGLTVERHAALAPLTTLRVGGPAAVLVRVSAIEDLVRVADVIGDDEPGEILVVGQGSNLLVADEGVDGLVIRLDPDGFSAIDIAPAVAGSDDRMVRAGGAVKLPVLARASVAAGVSGLEWMVGVPGSVGGAVRMNAGGHGSDMAASLVRARIFSARTGGLDWCSAAELGLGYRSSLLTADQVVVEVELEGVTGPREAGEAVLAEIVRWRREHQPGGANCGSVFTNPPGDSAGRLIDASDLKGARIGGATVSEKHANFIQAEPGAAAADVWALIDRVRVAVHARYGIVLHPEVRTAGPLPPLTDLIPSPPADDARDAPARPSTPPGSHR
jgi:UDP-N-acetylmuramate dehydrogenase